MLCSRIVPGKDATQLDPATWQEVYLHINIHLSLSICIYIYIYIYMYISLYIHVYIYIYLYLYLYLYIYIYIYTSMNKHSIIILGTDSLQRIHDTYIISIESLKTHGIQNRTYPENFSIPRAANTANVIANVLGTAHDKRFSTSRYIIIYIYIFLYLYLSIYLYLSLYMYMYMYTCIYTYIYIYIYTHTYIYVYKRFSTSR